MAFEQRLIKLVRDKKCLYHTKSRSSKNNMIRVAIWQSISNELGRPVLECKQRWRSLRDRFVRERKKIELTGSSSEVDRWEHYDMLKFLASSVQKRRQRPSTSPIVGDNISFDGSFQSKSPNTNCTTVLNTTNEDYVTPNLYEETSQSIISNSAFDHPEDSKEIFVDDYGGINTVMTSKSMQEVNENPLHFETVRGIPSIPKNTRLTSKSMPNENHMHFESLERIPSTSKRSFATLKDSNEAFLDLLGGLKTAVDTRLLAEKDENDLFLECIGKKMKRLSEGAKLRIQAKLLANVTEELMNE